MLWPPAETRPTFGRYKPAGQNPLISGRLELVGLKKVETHAKLLYNYNYALWLYRLQLCYIIWQSKIKIDMHERVPLFHTEIGFQSLLQNTKYKQNNSEQSKYDPDDKKNPQVLI